MTYAQGMSAQMTAAVSIGLASYTGMPVSTTHVLSSSVAGTMVVDGGGLQRKTVTSILMAWVFTLPAAVLAFRRTVLALLAVPVIVHTKTSGSVYWPAFFMRYYC
ncbi:low-affinity inorganic phosphate transporter [Escherichia coli]|uniref:Low-affinity inorganic phosphate transporter n=1 Tax=Escherichia coli TaxID=562 RepID=A0A376TX61_ECOLX|nr:low-affinity inorganic phosphate transporter [Escherichia coli]